MRSARGLFALLSPSRRISCSPITREHAVNEDVFVYCNNKVCHTPLEAKLPPTQFLNLYDIQRRQLAIFIPHFCVGSILKVTWTDKTSPSGLCKFTGICSFHRMGGIKVSSMFTLRNVVHEEEVLNISFELYSPIIHSIELIRFQRLVSGKGNLKDLEEYPLSASKVPSDLKQIITDKPVILTSWKTRPYLTDEEVQDQIRDDNLKLVNSPEELKLAHDPYYRWLKTEYSGDNVPEEKLFDIDKPTEKDIEQWMSLKVKLHSLPAKV